MKNLIKNNWFKISVIAVVVVLSLLISATAFYFYKFYKTDRDREYFQQQAHKCAELSDKYTNDNYSKERLSAINTFEYHFNKRLNTCVIYFDVHHSGSGYYNDTQRVIDLITNKTI